MNRLPFVVAMPLFLLAACEDGTGPTPNPGPGESGVTASFDDDVLFTDSSVVVNGELLFDFPNIDQALRLERYHHFDFGGTTFSSSVSHSESWRLMLIHQTSELERNDSTIWNYADHGDALIEGIAMEKLTDEPHVMPGDPLGFDSFAMYLQTSSLRIRWIHNGETVEETPYHDDMAAGREIEIVTTGSDGVPAASGSFELASVAELVAVENGAALDLDAVVAPTLVTGEPLVLEFDDAIDPERAYIFVHPMYPAPAGARRALLQIENAAERVIIPTSILEALVESAGTEPVAYRVTVHEYWVDDDALSGTAFGEPYSLPLWQISETSLEVWLQP